MVLVLNGNRILRCSVAGGVMQDNLATPSRAVECVWQRNQTPLLAQIGHGTSGVHQPLGGNLPAAVAL
jgi:hypothetical protein